MRTIECAPFLDASLQQPTNVSDLVANKKNTKTICVFGLRMHRFAKDIRTVIIVLYMEYSCYKDAFDAVVEDNDGVLPDLYEVFDFIIYCRPSYLVGSLTVAEIVAYALLEAAEDKAAISSLEPIITHQLYVPVSASEPLYLESIVDLKALSDN